MPRRVKLTPTLNRALRSTDLNQKGLSVISKTPTATVSDHLNGREVTFDKAMDYLDAMEQEQSTEAVNHLTSGMSHKFLGFIKSMDGELAEICTTAELEIFQKMESDERKERKKRAEILIVQSKVKRLDQQEISELRDYALEFLDEIIVELAIVFSILKIIGMTIREAVRIKMPEWVAKKYMRG
jgi:hypothetical protein